MGARASHFVIIGRWSRIVYRHRTGCAWRDLPEQFGPWQTVWKRRTLFSGDVNRPALRRPPTSTPAMSRRRRSGRCRRTPVALGRPPLPAY
ncbi:MAG: transposase [Mycobacterium leprae]